jgi:hypothetical protein
MMPLKEKFILYPYASWFFALAMLITWVGFSTTYFARLGASTAYHHVHGATAGLWIALLIVQPLLYKYGKLKLHRKLGWIASIILIPLLVLGGLKMIQMMIQRQDFYPPGEVYRLSFIDFYSLIQFLLFLGLSLYHGKRIHLHARYMACTVLTLLPPAITRLLFFVPFLDTFTKTLNVSFACVEITVLVLILDDKKNGSFRKPYFFALVIFGLLHLLMNFAGGWAFWKSLMDGYAG